MSLPTARAVALANPRSAVRLRLWTAVGNAPVQLGTYDEAHGIAAERIAAARGLDRQAERMCLDVDRGPHVTGQARARASESRPAGHETAAAE
ncbi:hypothetical protein [Kitasatospora aureofaciens]|uniref:hypothetical protein n=1 Tax=Kitasatospora aureofaciens TaxID=1894 RepID=UPI0037CABA03